MSVFDKLAAAEQEFFDSDFISPVVQGMPVRVSIASVVMEMKITPKNFEGWGVFKPINGKEARLVREPTRAEKRRYLEVCPQTTIVVSHQGDRTMGICANKADNRFDIQGLVPVLLASEVRVFDTIQVRFDGSHFWHDGRSNRSPKIANELRAAVNEMVDPGKLDISGVTPEEMEVYRVCYANEIANRRDLEEDKLREAVVRGGGDFKSYTKRADAYTVRYSINGRDYTSTVDQNTMEVVSSGVCLNGFDRDFDLQSLMTVMSERDSRGSRW